MTKKWIKFSNGMKITFKDDNKKQSDPVRGNGMMFFGVDIGSPEGDKSIIVRLHDDGTMFWVDEAKEISNEATLAYYERLKKFSKDFTDTSWDTRKW